VNKGVDRAGNPVARIGFVSGEVRELAQDDVHRDGIDESGEN